MENYYIYTEIVNCGKIGKIAIDSFHKYHNHKIHIYGTNDDFKHINPHENNIFIEVDQSILDGYKMGHVGTALLWEQVIRHSKEDYFIHFDSDVIFRENIIDMMIDKSKEYDLIGPIRNYHHNPHGIKNISHLTDICQTNCTLFNRKYISEKYLNNKISFDIKKILYTPLIQILRNTKWFIKNTINKNKMSIFARMIHGTYNPFLFSTIDFFDPIMFDMIQNGAKIYHLDFNEVGGCDYYGKRDNKYKEINNFPTRYKLDFGSKLVHFSCVGSGMNFYMNKDIAKKESSEYVKSSLDRYALYCKIFYNEDIGGTDMSQYKDILAIKNWY